MDAFISSYVWPAIIMIAQSLLLLVALLIFIAYILLPTARSGRPCNCGADRTWSGPGVCSSPLRTC